MYMASLLLSSGIACEFVTIGNDRQNPMRFSHVYVQAILEDGSKMPLDPLGPAPGWEPPWICRKEWGIVEPPQGRKAKDNRINPKHKAGS